MTGTLALMRINKTAQLRKELEPDYQPKIELPWPPADLNPNARVHWGTKSRAAAAYKKACWTLLLQHKPYLKGKSSFKITFCPPDRIRRDCDNLVAAFKNGSDALSLVAGVDDSKFKVTYAMGDVSLNGCVRVEIA